MAVGDWSTRAAIDRPRHHHSAVFGTARYAVVRLGPLSLAPSLGLGAARSEFWTDPGPDEPRLGFGLGLRGGAMIPLGGDSRWTLDLGDSRVEDLEGPAAPAGGWYLGLDVGIAFGLGRDD